MEIKFTQEDVGKTVYNIINQKYEKIISVSEHDGPLSVQTNATIFNRFRLNGKYGVCDPCPQLLPLDHPAVKAGKLEIPIPAPTKKKIVLEPGWYLKDPSGRVIPVEEFAYVKLYHGDTCSVFEIKEPIILQKGI